MLRELLNVTYAFVEERVGAAAAAGIFHADPPEPVPQNGRRPLSPAEREAKRQLLSSFGGAA